MKTILVKLFGVSGTKTSEGKTNDYDKPADFETAIAATGFGKFNFLLLVAALPTCWASIFETTTMSYVFPAAQCDLNLSLENKGMLNAITFIGTVCSAFLWGFLYDTYGRRKLLLIGFLLDGIFVILSGLSQNLIFLMITKFLGGFVISGPFAALTSYFSEMHVAKYRARIPLVMGICFAAGGIYLPYVASLILPMDLKINITNEWTIYSWGLFLFVNAVPSLLSALTFLFLPESPKFLMAVGKNEQALKVFRRIYSINTGNPKDFFPVKELINEKADEEKSSKASLKGGWEQIRNLFFRPYLTNFILVCALQLLMTMSFNTFRLWLPQLFQAMNDYKFLNNGTSSSLCEMLSVLREKNSPEECFVNFDNFEVYRNSMMVCFISMIGYVVAGSVVNFLGQNKLLAIASFVAAIFALGIYFSPNSKIATVFITGLYSLGGLGTNAVVIVIVNLFPTTLRGTTLSLSLMFGRAGSVVGNIMFPYLIELGCGPPIFMLAGLLFSCFVLTVLLPKQKKVFV